VKPLDTTMGGDQRGFPPTPALLKSAGPAWADAMDVLSRVYWKPVYLYIRTVWGNTNEDAKDLAQQFFLHVMKNQAVERYRPARAAFRTYIKACLKNFLLDEARRRESLKSGGDRTEVAIDALDESATPAAESRFERAWVQSVLEEALAATRRELAAAGRESSWRLFEAYDLRDPSAEKATYAELGAPLGMSEADVRNALAYVRGRLRELVVAEVRRCVADPEQLAEELGHLNLL
jgi:RNA polymerase sigma factor (sigma-70 family)